MSTQLWWVYPESIPATPTTLALLSHEEREQQQRFIPAKKRQEFLAARVLVRSVMGQALGIAPDALRFERNEWGRPALVPTSLLPTSSPIHFNVSHTDGLVVCLVSTSHEIGIDTELLSRAPALLALAPRVFAPQEQSDLAELADDEKLYRAVLLWTLKESYIKARGMGMALPLDGFAFSFNDDRVTLNVAPELNDDGARWDFQTRILGSHLVSTAMALPAASAAAQKREKLSNQTSNIVVSRFCPADTAIDEA
jgi:4'-phosphopantetheinyl transferase